MLISEEERTRLHEETEKKGKKIRADLAASKPVKITRSDNDSKFDSVTIQVSQLPNGKYLFTRFQVNNSGVQEDVWVEEPDNLSDEDLGVLFWSDEDRDNFRASMDEEQSEMEPAD